MSLLMQSATIKLDASPMTIALLVNSFNEINSSSFSMKIILEALQGSLK